MSKFISVLHLFEEGLNHNYFMCRSLWYLMKVFSGQEFWRETLICIKIKWITICAFKISMTTKALGQSIKYSSLIPEAWLQYTLGPEFSKDW